MTSDEDGNNVAGVSPEDGHEVRSDAVEMFSVSAEDGSIGLAPISSFAVVCPDCDRQVQFVEPVRAQAWIVGHYNAEHPDKLPPFSNDSDES